jgi:methyltransferase-like protein/2-polyprenyl-3-methyl-5-hydroxy-6-metoxy-1,4-benzoquinol methylase
LPSRRSVPSKPEASGNPGVAELAAAQAPSQAPESEEARLAAQAYDEFPYESHSFPLTHPERLATIASLFGMRPPPPSAARVLELGCAAGGNLIPMAVAMPGATFTGFDLSGVQIEQARETIGALGLRNIAVDQRNILEIGKEAGEFDYIICHGVYSWVPEEVQERILAICRACMSENGVALISYNTYPGWHLRESVREMMRYHARQFDDPKVQVAQSRALLDFLVKSVDSEKTAYGMYLAGELKLLASCGDYYIAHEHLERWNSPVYFYQFAERLARHQLQFLGESEFGTMMVKNLAASVAETLSRGIHDVLRMEQYMDFIRNRMFRSTLVCHRERGLERQIDSARVMGFYVAAGVNVDRGAKVKSAGHEGFTASSGVRFQTGDALLKEAIRILAAAWPRAIPFDDLFAEAEAAGVARKADVQDQRRLAANLLKLFSANAVELHSVPSRFVTSISETPLTTSLVRLQASRGARVTNLRHEPLPVNDVERTVLRLLDGTLGRSEIVNELAAGVDSGKLSLKRDGRPVKDPADRATQLGRMYDQLLSQFARKALLAG